MSDQPIRFDYAELAKPDRTHARLYTDPDIFAEEMEKIFRHSWVYVAHESEIPKPGDYLTTYIGLIPVIVTRDEAGKVHVLVNRCMHRGATVCPYEKGAANAFTCPYHGWEYALDGRLNAVGLPKGYNPGEIDKGNLGLREAAKVGSYRGIIFAVLDEVPDISLEEKLGPALPILDAYMDLSPTGEIEVGRSGVYKHAYHGNWKIQVEGSVEGYHPVFTHQSAFETIGRTMGINPKSSFTGSGKTGLLGRDLGHGNNILEVYKYTDEQVSQRYPQAYIDLLKDAHGEKRAMAALRTRFNLVIFPNLAILEYQFRVTRPVQVDLSEVRIYHTMLKGLPEEFSALNLRRVREHEFFYGPAAFGGPDDYVAFERIQQGLVADEEAPWVLLNRGYTTEQVDAEGCRYGDLTQETQQRAPYYEYRRLMARSLEAV